MRTCALLLACLATATASLSCGRTNASTIVEGRDLHGKTIAITGGDSGIGYETALALAAANATLLLLPHNPTKGKAAADNISKATGNDRITVIILDLSALSSIRTAASCCATSARRRSRVSARRSASLPRSP